MSCWGMGSFWMVLDLDLEVFINVCWRSQA